VTKTAFRLLPLAAATLWSGEIASAADRYQNFRVAVYARAYNQTGLFAYDNGRFIVENFAAPGGQAVAARAVVSTKAGALVDVVTGERIAGQARGDRMVFDLTVPAASYRVFSTE